MTTDNWAPLAGFSIALLLLLGAIGTFSLLLWLTVPFTLFSIRGQMKQQVEILRRIEAGLAETAERARASRPSPGAAVDAPVSGEAPSLGASSSSS